MVGEGKRTDGGVIRHLFFPVVQRLYIYFGSWDAL